MFHQQEKPIKRYSYLIIGVAIIIPLIFSMFMVYLDVKEMQKKYTESGAKYVGDEVHRESSLIETPSERPSRFIIDRMTD